MEPAAGVSSTTRTVVRWVEPSSVRTFPTPKVNKKNVAFVMQFRNYDFLPSCMYAIRPALTVL